MLKKEKENMKFYDTSLKYMDAINALGYTSNKINNEPLLSKALNAAKKELLDEY